MKEQIIAVLLCIVLVIAITVSCRADVKTERAEYIVKSGDTLWDIYEEYAPRGISFDEYKFNIKRDNGLKTCDIYSGMVLEIVREAK